MLGLEYRGLFVGFFVPLENFSFILIHIHYQWRAANFHLHICSTLIAIEQWGFFSVPHLLWHGTFNYNGHQRGPLTLTQVTGRLAVELSLPVLTTYICHGWDSKTQLSVCVTNPRTDSATAAALLLRMNEEFFIKS